MCVRGQFSKHVCTLIGNTGYSKNVSYGINMNIVTGLVKLHMYLCTYVRFSIFELCWITYVCITSLVHRNFSTKFCFKIPCNKFLVNGIILQDCMYTSGDLLPQI